MILQFKHRVSVSMSTFRTLHHREHWTDFSAKSHCYYTDIDECYAGPFFEMAKVVLDFYAPNSYVSEIALGKRIQRVLSHK